MNSVIRAGDSAKDFALKDQHDNEVRLAHFTGKKVLLSFHPLAWTIVCTEQMKALEVTRDKLDILNTVALGISVDPVPTKNAWAREIGILNTKLLSDFWPHGDIAKSYGIFREANGFSERANIILDEQHRVILVRIYPIAEVPDIQEILEVLSP